MAGIFLSVPRARIYRTFQLVTHNHNVGSTAETVELDQALASTDPKIELTPKVSYYNSDDGTVHSVGTGGEYSRNWFLDYEVVDTTHIRLHWNVSAEDAVIKFHVKEYF